jgi:aspartyl-tRNA(Asn)/glutamyl-tRNA(Gln) amidotransferase subunit A
VTETFHTLDSIALELKTKRVSPTELLEYHLNRIDALNDKFNLYITVNRENSLLAAKQATKEILLGRYKGPLHGIPYSVKDIFYTKGIPTTAGEKKLRRFISDHNATIVSKLQNAGAILTGKAHPSYGEFFPNPEYGFTKNPWNILHFAGYSSDGPAAAVALGTDLFSIGSDGGGSIRYPAASCGVIGLKPTFGRVSRYGSTVLGIPNDYVGPLTKTAKDTALVMNIIAGHDEKDPYSSNHNVPDYQTGIENSIKNVKIGVLSGSFWESVDLEISEAINNALNIFKNNGCEIEYLSMSTIGKAGNYHTLLSEVESSAYYQDQLKRWPSYYPDILMRRVINGRRVLAIDYMEAVKIRKRLIEEINGCFKQVDLLLTPITMLPPPLLGQFSFKLNSERLGISDLSSKFCRPFNMSGHPAISVPCGFTSNGLPLAFQLVSAYFNESVLLNAANIYQKCTQWHLSTPNITL